MPYSRSVGNKFNYHVDMEIRNMIKKNCGLWKWMLGLERLWIFFKKRNIKQMVLFMFKLATMLCWCVSVWHTWIEWKKILKVLVRPCLILVLSFPPVNFPIVCYMFYYHLIDWLAVITNIMTVNYQYLMRIQFLQRKRIAS